MRRNFETDIEVKFSIVECISHIRQQWRLLFYLIVGGATAGGVLGFIRHVSSVQQIYHVPMEFEANIPSSEEHARKMLHELLLLPEAGKRFAEGIVNALEQSPPDFIATPEVVTAVSLFLRRSFELPETSTPFDKSALIEQLSNYINSNIAAELLGGRPDGDRQFSFGIIIERPYFYSIRVRANSNAVADRLGAAIAFGLYHSIEYYNNFEKDRRDNNSRVALAHYDEKVAKARASLDRALENLSGYELRAIELVGGVCSRFRDSFQICQQPLSSYLTLAKDDVLSELNFGQHIQRTIQLILLDLNNPGILLKSAENISDVRKKLERSLKELARLESIVAAESRALAVIQTVFATKVADIMSLKDQHNFALMRPVKDAWSSLKGKPTFNAKSSVFFAILGAVGGLGIFFVLILRQVLHVNTETHPNGRGFSVDISDA